MLKGKVKISLKTEKKKQTVTAEMEGETKENKAPEEAQRREGWLISREQGRDELLTEGSGWTSHCWTGLRSETSDECQKIYSQFIHPADQAESEP